MGRIYNELANLESLTLRHWSLQVISNALASERDNDPKTDLSRLNYIAWKLFKLTSQNILAPRKFHHAVWESIAGGYGSPLWRLSAMTYRSMLPQIARLASVPALCGPRRRSE